MQLRRTRPRRAAWDDLDALVLEEVEAASRTSARLGAVAPPFGSDEDFLALAAEYLAAHEDPRGLLERLGASVPPRREEEKPQASAEPAPPDADQGPES